MVVRHLVITTPRAVIGRVARSHTDLGCRRRRHSYIKHPKPIAPRSLRSDPTIEAVPFDVCLARVAIMRLRLS